MSKIEVEQYEHAQYDSNVAIPKQDSKIEEGDGDHIESHIHMKTILVVLAICFIYFAQLVNIVGAGAFARDIAAAVGGSTDSVWLTSTVTIFTVVLSPPVSQAADYWGRKWFLVGLTSCGFVGSLIVSRATSMPMAIVGEAITGISYGAQPLLHAVSSEVLPRKWRPYAQGAVNVAAAMGAFTGLLTGGALTRNEHFEGFRPYWYMAAAIYAAAAIICAVLYNPPQRELQISLSTKEKLHRLDWGGYALLTTGLVLFCVGLSFSQNPYPWTNARVLATFITGAVFSIGLILYEWLVNKEGMFHHGLFRRGRNLPVAVGCVFVEGLVFFAANNYFAFQTSVLYASDPFTISLRYSITFIVYALSSILVGLYCSRTKKVKIPTIAAFASFIIFNILMATSTLGSSNALWGYTVFLGIGLGACLCSLVTIAQLSTPPELMFSVASGLMISMRSLGGSVGLAVYNAIFNGQLSDRLGPSIAAAAVPLGLPPTSIGPLIVALTSQNTAALRSVEGITPAIIGASVHALQKSFLESFRFVWIAASCFTVIALIASAFLVESKGDFNSNIDAPAETEAELRRT